jgi:methyl-accepting chemotaxis protein
VQDAGSTMDEIVASVRRVSDIIGEITAAASEQNDGIGQINVAVSQLDQMTQQNAALVEESAAAAESLREQAQRLAGVVGTFKVDAHDRATASPTPLPAQQADQDARAVIARAQTQARSVVPAAAAPVAAAATAATEPSKPAAASAPTLSRNDDDWETF